MVRAAGNAPQADVVVRRRNDARHLGTVVRGGVVPVAGQHLKMGVSAHILVFQAETAVDHAHRHVVAPLLVLPCRVGTDGLDPPIGTGGLVLIRLGAARRPGVRVRFVRRRHRGRIHKGGDLAAGVHHAVGSAQGRGGLGQGGIALGLHIYLQKVHTAADIADHRAARLPGQGLLFPPGEFLLRENIDQPRHIQRHRLAVQRHIVRGIAVGEVTVFVHGDAAGIFFRHRHVPAVAGAHRSCQRLHTQHTRQHGSRRTYHLGKPAHFHMVRPPCPCRAGTQRSRFSIPASAVPPAHNAKVDAEAVTICSPAAVTKNVTKTTAFCATQFLQKRRP